MALVNLKCGSRILFCFYGVCYLFLFVVLGTVSEFWSMLGRGSTTDSCFHMRLCSKSQEGRNSPRVPQETVMLFGRRKITAKGGNRERTCKKTCYYMGLKLS